MATAIDIALIKTLRESTGAGVSVCKEALLASGGDLEAATQAMLKLGQIQAKRKSTRIAAEGLISIKSDLQGSLIAEINCETDFAAQDKNFKQFSEAVTQLALQHRISSTEALLSTAFSDTGESVENARQSLIAKLGENIQIRRLLFVAAVADSVLGAYVHVGRFGAIVQLQGGDESLAKDLALHIIANNPLVIAADSVPADMIEKEREIFTVQAQASGKPSAVIDKMVEGRIAKFLNEVTLLGQPFIKDETINVKTLLEQSQAKVIHFVRFALGEGIVKPKEDFASAVMAQLNHT